VDITGLEPRFYRLRIGENALPDIVGYINTRVSPGYSMIANHFDAGNGGSIAELIPTAPYGTTIYKFDGATFNSAVFDEFDEAWLPGDMTLSPGEGVFIENFTDDTFTITFFGRVLQGELSKELVPGLSIVSSMLPMTGDANMLEFPKIQGIGLYIWNGSIYNYSVFDEFDEKYIPPLQIKMGEAFWIENSAGAVLNWVMEGRE